MSRDSVWISPSVLSFEVDGSGSSSDLEHWDLPYVDVNHAFAILEQHKSTGFLKDAIINLERAIKFRLKMLNDIYRFKNMPATAGKDQLKSMLDLGLIKPLMLEKITKIRNGVQHNLHASIPQHNECLELAEFAWYFLRSTDGIARSKTSDISLYYPENEYHADQSFDFYPEHKWLITSSSRLPKQLVSRKKNEGWIEITTFQKDKYIESLKPLAFCVGEAEKLITEYDDHFLVQGEVTHSSSSNKVILEYYFHFNG